MEGFVCIFALREGKNYGVTAVETGGKQQSTGLLLFIFQIPPQQKKIHTGWCGSFSGGDGGI